ANQHTIAINPFACDSVEAFGDVETLHLDRRTSAFGQFELQSAVTEPVLGKIVAVAFDVEVNLLVQQTGFIERDDPVAVGPQRNVVHGPQFHERHAAAGLFIHDGDSEVVVCCTPADWNQQEQDGQGMTKSEIRMTKEIRSTKAESRRSYPWRSSILGFCHSHVGKPWAFPDDWRSPKVPGAGRESGW